VLASTDQHCSAVLISTASSGGADQHRPALLAKHWPAFAFLCMSATEP